jgi:hypothetical protein
MKSVAAGDEDLMPERRMERRIHHLEALWQVRARINQKVRYRSAQGGGFYCALERGSSRDEPIAFRGAQGVPLRLLRKAWAD